MKRGEDWIPGVSDQLCLSNSICFCYDCNHTHWQGPTRVCTVSVVYQLPFDDWYLSSKGVLRRYRRRRRLSLA
jgi:hypothetical protein